MFYPVPACTFDTGDIKRSINQPIRNKNKRRNNTIIVKVQKWQLGVFHDVHWLWKLDFF